MSFTVYAVPGQPPTSSYGPGPYGRPQSGPSGPFGPFGPPGAVGGRRPARRILPGLAVGLLVGIVELLVLVAVGKLIGPGLTILLVLATSVLGAWLLRREGAKSWRAFRASLQERRPPGPSATEGLLVLVGGVLMVMPGLVTDLVGAVLVVPPTRRLLARWAQSTLARRLTPSAATSLFGPRTVRVRTGAPQQASPAEPAAGVADPPRATAESPMDPIEGEIIDPR